MIIRIDIAESKFSSCPSHSKSPGVTLSQLLIHQQEIGSMKEGFEMYTPCKNMNTVSFSGEKKETSNHY
jgi:hypothetical protein